MDTNLKNRIKKIEMGIIPPGYKKIKFKIVPNDWESFSISQLCEVLNGGTPSTENSAYWDGDIPWCTPTDITKSSKYISTTEKKITKAGLKNSSAVLLPKNSILMCSRATIGPRAINTVEMATNQGFKSFVCDKSKLDYEFFYYLLDIYVPHFKKLGSGSTFLEISKKDVETTKVIIPVSLKEQRKIATILSTWDKAIELKEKLIEQKKRQKNGLMRNLLTGKMRLPGFEGKWSKKSFEDIFIKLSVKKNQIKTNEYLKVGKYPVVDQGQQKIIAYSNDEDKVLKVPDAGLIVFGDHTREIKYIDFDFVVGADGTQVLNTKEGFDLKFYYYHLLIQKIPNNGYSRHFKFLKELMFYEPPLEEQIAISNVLSTFDHELELLNSELSLLKFQKKGLMQLLLTGKMRVKV